MTTIPTMPSTDQPTNWMAPAAPAGQFPPTAPFPPAAASASPPAGTARPTVPARRRTAWLIAGCTLLAVALLQLTRLPEWMAYDERGLVGNLTGVVALVGIGIALIITGRERRR
jgi:hypothetical protein